MKVISQTCISCSLHAWLYSLLISISASWWVITKHLENPKQSQFSEHATASNLSALAQAPHAWPKSLKHQLRVQQCSTKQQHQLVTLSADTVHGAHARPLFWSLQHGDPAGAFFLSCTHTPPPGAVSHVRSTALLQPLALHQHGRA